MTEADLTRIESDLGVNLPGFYREYALRLADEDARFVDELFERFGEALSSPYTSADEVVATNGYFRDGTLYWGVGGDRRPFPAERILVIGENGGGNYCFVYTDGSDNGLWWWDHETLDIDRHHTTLADFHEWLARLLAESEASEQP